MLLQEINGVCGGGVARCAYVNALQRIHIYQSSLSNMCAEEGLNGGYYWCCINCPCEIWNTPRYICMYTYTSDHTHFRRNQTGNDGSITKNTRAHTGTQAPRRVHARVLDVRVASNSRCAVYGLSVLGVISIGLVLYMTWKYVNVWFNQCFLKKLMKCVYILYSLCIMSMYTLYTYPPYIVVQDCDQKHKPRRTRDHPRHWYWW
jgi:hypothetical protein